MALAGGSAGNLEQQQAASADAKHTATLSDAQLERWKALDEKCQRNLDKAKVLLAEVQAQAARRKAVGGVGSAPLFPLKTALRNTCRQGAPSLRPGARSRLKAVAAMQGMSRAAPAITDPCLA